jgi:rfaE bifunctional protein kinase chain/domain
MEPNRFAELTSRYPALKIAVLGDFCLDRYLEIDPAKQELSLETSLPVHNVVNVRAQPGGAGTIVSNLSALGIGAIYPIGFAGDDGEGYELWRALEHVPRIRMTHFVKSAQRRTFTYCKPLLMHAGKVPVELNRLDSRNWTETPAELQNLFLNRLDQAAAEVNAIIVLDQTDIAETGVVTNKILEGLARITNNDSPFLLADSRRTLRGFPPVVFKMNANELSALKGGSLHSELESIEKAASSLAIANRNSVFVTLAERGILGADAKGQCQLCPALPVRGPIDVVGAGDAVSANLTAALTAGANVTEALELANAAASVVIHKLGTTGTANLQEIESLLCK